MRWPNICGSFGDFRLFSGRLHGMNNIFIWVSFCIVGLHFNGANGFRLTRAPATAQRMARGMTMNIRPPAGPTVSTAALSLKPVIMLDVDGIIGLENSRTPSTPASELWQDARSVDQQLLPGIWKCRTFVYSPTVISKITAWSAVADIRWLTSWAESALDLGKLLSLPPFPVMAYDAIQGWDYKGCGSK